MDMFALELGLDPVDVRRKNLIPKFDEPYTTVVGQTYDVGDFEGASTRRWPPPATRSCGPSRSAGGRRATRCSSASASAAMSEITAGPALRPRKQIE